MAPDRSRPWKRGSEDTQVGVPPAPRGAGDDTSVEVAIDPDTQPARGEWTDPDTQRVSLPPGLRVGDETELVPGLQLRAQAPADLAAYVARIRAAPADPAARQALRAIAGGDEIREQLAALLGDAARTADRPEAATALLEELAEVLEDLDRPIDAIDALEQLVRLAPGELAHHERLALLYQGARAWVKAAAAFEQVAALAPAGDTKARGALRAAARLYRDHGRPERAIEVYRRMAALHPADLEVWRSIDELLESLGRWRELAEVRGVRAARAGDGVDKAALLRAQARALEQAGDREAAAAAITEAARLAPERMSGLADHADVLARAGRGREAAELLARRVAEELRRGSGAPAGEDARAGIRRGADPEALAALRLRHAAILEDACGDRAAAAAVLDELLAQAPDYQPALERLVWQAAHDPDPRVHAAALLRQAAALPAGPDRAAALIEAARRLRDAGDRPGAARAFDEACELLPDDVGLALERDQARAAVLIHRAADEARAGDVASAERRLRGVLAIRPHDVDANLALAQLLEDAGRAEGAAEHLFALLEAKPDPFPREARARLVHRYAQLVAALGAPDAAHQLLHEAHRLDRRNLLVTLALGESCFARKLWRESAIHLGSLADHPDAPRHAAAVAAALVRAAQADVRALRPGNAEARLSAAVKLDPACAPAWHRLGELAMERGDTRAAADHLEREAAATADPRDRARLYDAVGDLARDMLGDLAQAERCWTAAADTAGAPTLEKLLALLRRRGAGRERARICERLAELVPAGDARARKELQEEAADAHAAAGDLERAAQLAARLMAAHPLDVDAVACASGVAIAAGDLESAAAWLGRALSAWDDGTAGRKKEPDPRRAELWRRLGDARRARGDTAGARLAYERAVAAAPEADGAQAARRGLVALAAAAGRSDAESLAGLVAAEQDPQDVVAWARECAAGARPAAAEDARPLFDLARALGAALAPADEQFLERHPARVLASDQAYAAPLPDAERRALVEDDADAPLAELLAQLGEVATLLCPAAPAALADAGLADAERLPATSAVAAVAIYPQIAKALGGPPTLLYRTASRSAADVTLLLAAPPVVVLGPRLVSQRAGSRAEVDATTDAELRFRLGRAVELARVHRCFAAGVPPERFVRFVEGLRWALLHPDDESPDAAVAREAKRLRGALPLVLRRRLAERLGPKGPPLDPAGYLAACERAADRSGLLACGDVGAAIRLAGGAKAARHLVQASATPRFLAARRTLWVAPPRR